MKQRRYGKTRKRFAILVTFALFVGILPIGTNVSISKAAGYGLKNPQMSDDGKTTWDCVWFGNYWQIDTNGDGIANKSDLKQPIKWRVLSVDGDDAFLVADQNLEKHKYNKYAEDVTWETCTMRSWLNGYSATINQDGDDFVEDNFLKDAFTTKERDAIFITNVVNEDNPEVGTEGGNDTKDKLFLLSLREVINSTYGFSSDGNYHDSRKSKNTNYVIDKGGFTNTTEENYGNGNWLLRSPGRKNQYVGEVSNLGYVSWSGSSVDAIYYSVRPALHLNLSSTSNWSYAGTVSSDGKVGGTTPTPASKISINGTTVTLGTINYTYDGTEKRPSVSVKDGIAALKAGTDYSISYSNNINAGTATILITGIGKYTGTISKNFTISTKSINGTAVTLATTTYTYDGTAKEPSVTVKDGTTTLKNGTDYSVSYSNNVNVGTATATITGKGNYTGTVTKIFTINAKIVEKKPFVWGESNWKFDNSNRYFSNYDVNSDVMNKMKKDFNLSNSDIVELKWNIANDNKSGFSGSCFGMTISEIMAHQGDLKLSRYGGNDIVNKNTNTSNMTSVINFIQELQSNSEMCQSIRQTPFLKGDYSQKEFVSKLSDVATNPNYLVKLSYKIVTKNTNNGSTNNGYHAVLVYGIEKCNYYSSVTGKTYDRKILIADPNYLSGNIINNNACLYFKSSDSSWIVPYWNKTYSNGNKQSCYWNAENGTSTSNGGIRNIMRYVSLKEEVDLMAEYSAGHYIAGLEIDNISKNVSSVEKVKNSGNPNVDYAGDFSEEIVRYDIDMDDDVYITENEELYALWNPTSSYILSYLKPSDYNLKMDYETVDYYADVTNSTYTLFKPNGSITLRGADSSYDITMVTDDSDCVTDWYSVSISGTDVDDLVYTKVKNGYTLSASRLENVKIFAEGENSAAETIFSTNYDDVFIYEIDKNTIGVAVDTDNNGSYETTIDTKGNSNPTDRPNEITSPTPTNEPSTTTSPTPTEVPDVTTSSKPTEQPNVMENPKPTDGTDTTTNSPLAGTVLKDNKNKVSYKVLAQDKTVAFYQVNNKKTTKIVVPITVTIDGTTYNVTAVSDNAFSGCEKLKSVTIGKYVTTIGNKAFFKCISLKKITIPASVTKIGKKAFYGCKKLKSITIKTQKLKSTSVGTQAFKGIHKKAVIKVPKKHKKVYKKWLRKKGITKKMKIK